MKNRWFDDELKVIITLLDDAQNSIKEAQGRMDMLREEQDERYKSMKEEEKFNLEGIMSRNRVDVFADLVDMFDEVEYEIDGIVTEIEEID